MRIVQITDLHVGHAGEDTYGVDVRANFLKIKAAIEDLQPDHLVLSGDLCYRTGQRDIYDWIRDHLNQLDIPYDLISGNHDDPVLMAEAFGIMELLKNKELYFSRTIHGRPFLFLDTTTGVVSETQLMWLRNQLAALSQPLVIFMHHPPLFADVPFMDGKHALKNQEAIQEVFFAYDNQITVFTGHYHVEKTIRKNNVVVHITPSCFFQIDQHSQEFKVDHHRIGLREIHWVDGTIMNTVKYL